MGDVPIPGAICNFSSTESNLEPATSNDIVDPSLNGSHVASASSLTGNEAGMLTESPELLQKSFMVPSSSNLSLRSFQSRSSQTSTSSQNSVSSQVSDIELTNNVQQDLSVLHTLVGNALKQLKILENVPKEPRPVVQTVKEAGQLYHERSLAAHTLHDVLMKTKIEITQRSEESEYLGFSDITVLIREKWAIMKKHFREMKTWKKLPSNALVRLVKSKSFSGEDFANRPSMYLRIADSVTTMVEEINNAVKEAEAQRVEFLKTGFSIASSTILRCAADAGYTKTDVFDGGLVLVERRFHKKLMAS